MQPAAIHQIARAEREQRLALRPVEEQRAVPFTLRTARGVAE
jgi:hypothetical protein